MTKNRANPNLSLQEEYERGGHTVKDLGTNAHAEGYVGSVPAVNAPGSLVIAGYSNCHVVPVAFSFNAVSHAMEPVCNLVSHMFRNDVSHLKRRGKLEMLSFVAAARLVGSYNQVVRSSEVHRESNRTSRLCLV